MNTPLLTPQEAFNAMFAGKNVLCRAVGELIDFADLDQFPATIFKKTGYEFCIKLDMIEVAGITFTKPLALEDIQDGQDVYTVNTYGQSIYINEFGKHACTGLINSINNGFVQRDADNAKLQLQAMSKMLGRELTGECMVVRLGDKPKPTRKAKAKADTPVITEPVEIEASTDVVDNSSQSNIQITAVTGTTESEDSLIPSEVKAPVKNSINELKKEITAKFGGNSIIEFKQPKSLHERIAEAVSIVELDALLPELHQLHGEYGHNMMTAYAKRKSDLSTVSKEIDFCAAPVNSTTAKQEHLSSIYRAKDIESLEVIGANVAIDSRLISTHRSLLSEHVKIQTRVKLIKCASAAKSPAEANALIKHTKDWTEEQRAPVLTAISKRLSELQELTPVEQKEPLTLMAKIQEAADLTALDMLEIDVGARAPDMQVKLMAEVVKRRVVLESQEAV